MFKKDCIWGPATCSCKSVKYLASITDDSVLAHDKIIQTQKLFQQRSLQNYVPLHCIKYARIRVFTDPCSPVLAQNRRFCLNAGQ